MIIGGIIARGLGRITVLLALAQSLGFIERMLQKYLLEIEPHTLTGYVSVMIILGVTIWGFGDLLVAIGKDE